MKNYVFLAAGLAIAFLQTGCGTNNEEPRVLAHKEHESKTHCIGRFTIDLPKGIEPVYRLQDGPGDATFYFGNDADHKTVEISVAAIGVSPDGFHAAVAARAATFEAQMNYQTNSPMLLDKADWSTTQTLLRHYDSADISDSIVYELHLLLGDAHVVLRTTSFDSTSRDAAEERVKSLARQARKIGEDEKPMDGFCIGPVILSSNNDYEEAKFLFRDANRNTSTLRFEIDIDTFGTAEDEPSLIERGEQNLMDLGVNPKVINKGQIKIAGMPAEEWLGSFKDQGVVQHGFYADTFQHRRTKSEPHLYLAFFAGEEAADGKVIESPLDDAAAVELWRSAIDSVKRRTNEQN